MILSKKYTSIDIIDPHIGIMKNKLSAEFPFLKFYDTLEQVHESDFDTITLSLPPTLRPFDDIQNNFKYRRLIVEKPITTDLENIPVLLIPYLRLFDLMSANKPKIKAQKTITINQSIKTDVDRELFLDLYSHLASTLFLFMDLDKQAWPNLKDYKFLIGQGFCELTFCVNQVDVSLCIKKGVQSNITYELDDRNFAILPISQSLLKKPLSTLVEITRGRQLHPYDYLRSLYEGKYDSYTDLIKHISFVDLQIWRFFHE